MGRHINWQGLQVVEKRFYGVTVGYIVGWWSRTSKWRTGKEFETFRNFREGVVWPTKEAAIEFRDSVEAQRKNSPPVREFISIDD